MTPIYRVACPIYNNTLCTFHRYSYSKSKKFPCNLECPCTQSSSIQMRISTSLLSGQRFKGYHCKFKIKKSLLRKRCLIIVNLLQIESCVIMWVGHNFPILLTGWLYEWVLSRSRYWKMKCTQSWSLSIFAFF